MRWVDARPQLRPGLPQPRARRGRARARSHRASRGRSARARPTCSRRSTSACVGRSFRTSNDRELIRFDAPVARARRSRPRRRGSSTGSRSASSAGGRRYSVDGVRPTAGRVATHGRSCACSPRIGSSSSRGRRPCGARISTRSSPRCGRPARETARALCPRARPAQRAARAGPGRRASASSLGGWTGSWPGHGVQLMADRAEAVDLLSPRFADARPPSWASTAPAGSDLPPAIERATRRELGGGARDALASDLERGFTTHGPHRDDMALALDDRALRRFGSQGQQRLALLALLLAERDMLAARRAAAARPAARRRPERARRRAPRAPARPARARRADAPDDRRSGGAGHAGAARPR